MRGSGSNWWQTVFFGLLLLIAGFLLIRSPIFEVTRIDVRGNELLPAAEVLSAAGLSTGVNIFRVHLGEAGEKLGALPLVKKAVLERRFPSTITVYIEERQPLVLVEMENAFWEVDADGVALRRQKVGVSGVPVLTGAGPGEDAMRGALAVAGGLPASVKRELSEINISGDHRITLYTVDGIPVHLGRADELGTQVLILGEVLDAVRASGRTVEYIDLAEPQNAVVKYKEGPR